MFYCNKKHPEVTIDNFDSYSNFIGEKYSSPKELNVEAFRCRDHPSSLKINLCYQVIGLIAHCFSFVNILAL